MARLVPPQTQRKRLGLQAVVDSGADLRFYLGVGGKERGLEATPALWTYVTPCSCRRSVPAKKVTGPRLHPPPRGAAVQTRSLASLCFLGPRRSRGPSTVALDNRDWACYSVMGPDRVVPAATLLLDTLLGCWFHFVNTVDTK